MRRFLLATVIATAILAALGSAFIWLRPDAAYRGTIALERWRAGLAPATIDAAGYRWAYLEGGSGPPLLLLHGFAADKDNWTRVAPYLTDRFRVVAPDLIGFGNSALPDDADYAIAAQAERVLAFASAVGLDRFHIGGSSMGGYIAGVMAARAPERVLSLWLLAPGGLASAEASEMFARIEAGSNPLIPATPGDFAVTLDFVFHEAPFIPGPIRAHLAEVASLRRPLLERIFAALRYDSGPLEDFLAGTTIPTLVVWGDRDRVLHPSGASVMARLVPHAEILLMEETGHLPMIERPRETAAAYLAWRAGLAATSAPAAGSSTNR